MAGDVTLGYLQGHLYEYLAGQPKDNVDITGGTLNDVTIVDATYTGVTIDGGTLENVAIIDSEITSLTSPLSIGNGGTGQITANAALNALLPTQTGQGGKALKTDGTNVSWSSDIDTGITQLTGDVTAGPGSGSQAATLATVNANVGSYGSSTSIPSFTVNAKGLITAASGNAVVAPAGTLTGATLAAGVTASSLTSVGTLTSLTVGGAVTLGANNITMTGSIAATGARVTKGWFTDIELTNAPTIGGVAATGTGGIVRAISPTFTGTPAAPTASPGTNTTQLATTAFVTTAISGIVTPTPITASLGANVTMTSLGTYYDGASVAQGSTGTWFASGVITVQETVGASFYDIKLWDGATVIASTRIFLSASGIIASAALSGYLASPAGNLRISAKSVSTNNALIVYNASGNSKDSTITAFRIA